MKHWYAAHTHAKSELKAVVNLKRQNMEVYFPQIRCSNKKLKINKNPVKPLFPRYVFVAIDIAKQRWRCINSTYGVKNIVSSGDKPIAVPENIMDELKSRGGSDGLINSIPKAPFRKGDQVNIIDGPLYGKTAKLDQLNDSQRVNVLLELMGRTVSVSLGVTSITLA